MDPIRKNGPDLQHCSKLSTFLENLTRPRNNAGARLDSDRNVMNAEFLLNKC